MNGIIVIVIINEIAHKDNSFQFHPKRLVPIKIKFY